MQITVGIIGLGLIGGSLALSLHSNYLINKKIKVIGFTQNQNTISNAPFECFSDYTRLNECNIVFICSPLGEILKILKNIQQYLRPDTIITDVGSIKGFIQREADEITRDDCIFIGGHPMAGTENSGFEYADAELFNNKTWVLLKQNSLLETVIRSTKANIIYTDSVMHDKAAALISHLPLFISCKLLQTLESLKESETKDNTELYRLASQMASSGFGSMTRLARGNSTLNKDILSLNQEYIEYFYQEFLKQSI